MNLLLLSKSVVLFSGITNTMWTNLVIYFPSLSAFSLTCDRDYAIGWFWKVKSTFYYFQCKIQSIVLEK